MKKRDIVIILGAVAAALILSISILSDSAIETASWGLSYRTQGAAPIGPASAKQLEEYDAAYLGNTAEKVIYLTSKKRKRQEK